MNQYIIDEKMIKSWRKGCVNLSNPHTDDETCKLCKHRGKGMRMDCCDFDDEDAERLFRSHPYNPQAEQGLWTTDELIQHEKMATDAEREKVLEKFVAFRMIANVKIEDETEGNYYTSVNAWREFELLLEELRQEGKVDQKHCTYLSMCPVQDLKEKPNDVACKECPHWKNGGEHR